MYVHDISTNHGSYICALHPPASEIYFWIKQCVEGRNELIISNFQKKSVNEIPSVNSICKPFRLGEQWFDGVASRQKDLKVSGFMRWLLGNLPMIKVVQQKLLLIVLPGIEFMWWSDSVLPWVESIWWQDKMMGCLQSVLMFNLLDWQSWRKKSYSGTDTAFHETGFFLIWHHNCGVMQMSQSAIKGNGWPGSDVLATYWNEQAK